MKADARPGSRRWMMAAVAVLAIGVYANSIPNGFALDDESIVERNPRVHGIERIGDAVSLPYWPDSPARLALYRPLTTATFAVEWDLWSGSPHGFHATNAVLHAVVTVLVFLLLGGLGAPVGAAGLGAAVFAVHPVHTEAVANIVGRAEPLAAAFYLLACLLYLRTAAPPGRRAAAIGVCYLLALGSKEIAVTLPAALLLLEIARRRPGRLREALRREAPVGLAVAGAGIVYAAVRTTVLGVPLGNDVAPFFAGLSWTERIATAVRVWPEYVRLMAFPRHLVADYSPAVLLPVEGFSWIAVFGAALAAAACTLGAAAWRRGRRWPAIAIAWFAVTVFPVSNLVVQIGVLLAERTLYLPSVAVAILASYAAVRARSARPVIRRGAVALAIVVLVLGGWRTVSRNPVWRSSGALMSDLTRTHPESFRVQWSLGEALVRDGDVEQGLHWMGRAIELVPNHYHLLVEYGLTLTRLGRPVRAEEVLRRAARLIPEHAEAHVALSRSLLNQGRGADALRVVRRARERFPDESMVYHQLAYVHDHLGRLDSAYVARRTSLRLAGDRAAWRQWLHLAELEYRRGREDAAVSALARARSAAPADARADLTLTRLRERLEPVAP